MGSAIVAAAGTLLVSGGLEVDQNMLAAHEFHFDGLSITILVDEINTFRSTRFGCAESDEVYILRYSPLVLIKMLLITALLVAILQKKGIFEFTTTLLCITE